MNIDNAVAELNILIRAAAHIIRRRRRRRRDILLIINAIQRRGPYNQLHAEIFEIGEILRGNEAATKKNLRISHNALINIFQLYPVKLQGWNMEYEVIIFLYWLACGTSYRVIAVTFQLARTTVFNIINRKLNETVALAPTLIKLPRIEHIDEIGNGFANLAQAGAFNHAVGAIDGCHIRISCPTAVHDQYINRKLFYSIQLQALCDHNGQIIDLYTGFPGSVHDARVLRHSTIYRNNVYPPPNYYLLGDCGYPNILRPITIITPFRGDNRTPQQQLFNLHHARGRNIIERAFGMMKTRWRIIFTRALELNIEKCVKTIVSCAVFHNVCTTNGDILNDINPPQVHNVEGRPGRDQQAGNEFRNAILQILLYIC